MSLDSNMQNSKNNIEIPQELQGYAAILDDTLYVANVKKQSISVLNFESRLKKSKKIEKKECVGLPKLQEIQNEIDAQQSGEIDTSELVQEAQNLFKIAAKKNASDIHIRIHENFADVLLRVDGALQEFSQMQTQYARTLLSTIYQVVCEDDSLSHPYYQPMTFQDARVIEKEYLPRNLHSIRVATGPKVGGRFMVLRLLYAETESVFGSLKESLEFL